MRKLIFLGLVILLAVLWWLPVEFPFDLKPGKDKSFSKTLSKKDDAFSDVLSEERSKLCAGLEAAQVLVSSRPWRAQSIPDRVVVLHRQSE